MKDGRIDWKGMGDLALARVFERHQHLGLSGTALLSGVCLKEGAVASTWVHDHHNLLVVGADEEGMVLAANSVIAHQGGLVVVRDGKKGPDGCQSGKRRSACPHDARGAA